MAYTTSFDGAADTLLSSFPGWAPTSGYYDVLSLNGSGALKSAAYSDDPKSLLNNTSSASHYVKVVVGSGFVASAGLIGIMFCAAGRSDSMALRYDAGTSLYLSKDGGGSAESLAGQTVAAGDELEVRWDAIAKFVVVKKNGTTIYSADITFYAGDKTGTSVGVWFNYNGSPAHDDIFRSWESDAIGAIDTDAPTLTAPTANVTGTTTATGSVTTTEAGPAWAVLTTAATTPTAAQIKAGQNSAGAASPAATATLVSGANSAAFSFTGLTPATGYYLHITQDDTATPANTATPVTAAMVTTSAPVVITLPALKNNTGTLLANEVGATVHVYAVATGNKVVTKTAQTSDAFGVMAVTDAALVAATEYRCVIVLASGAEGLQKATAA